MSVGIPPPPRSPSKRARQLIYAYRGKQAVFLLMGVIFFLVGAPLTLVFCQGLLGEVAISMGSRTCTGHVTRTELQRNVTINGRHPTRIVFDYALAGRPASGVAVLHARSGRAAAP